jgi:hypothetical protein
MENLLLKDIKTISNEKKTIHDFLEQSWIELKENFDFAHLDFDSMRIEQIQEKRNEVLSYFSQIPWFQWLWLAVIEKIKKEEHKAWINALNVYSDSEKKKLFDLFEWDWYANRENLPDMWKIKNIFPWWIKDFLEITVDGLSKLQSPNYPKEIDDDLLFNIMLKAQNSREFGYWKEFIKYLWYKLVEKWCSLTFIDNGEFTGMRPMWGIAIKVSNAKWYKRVLVNYGIPPFRFEQS